MRTILQILVGFIFLVIISSVIYAVSRFDNSGFDSYKLKNSLSEIPINNFLYFSGEGNVDGISLRGWYRFYNFDEDKKSEIVNFYLDYAKIKNWELMQKNSRDESMVFCANGIAYSFDFSVYGKLMMGVYWTSNRNSQSYCR